MKVIINTGHNIPLSEDSIAEMELLVESTLEHFAARLTRVEVHLTDGSAGRSTGDDIRCRLEARPEGLNPEFVSDDASTVDAAVSGALQKLTHVLDTTFGRRDDKHRGGN
ncbi:HPF/RaiA family ribosome-associated protein [Demequina lutea]|uniref:Sigma 54 modulation protein / S30EA ribosomal protein n=1 Tax=Demequina lutea TaxID=431489 RepID=A0A7Y9ZCE8_9MICO|nr:HPF/RaiA family ribosome-associated protein [Demequina lutea]NYI41425.1 hypothetical protein [Demequina lutea]